MRLMRQIIKKKFTKFLENVSNKRNDYWDFFQVYNVLAVANNKSLPANERIHLVNIWRNSISGVNVETSLAKIENFVDINSYMVTNFLRDTEDLDKKETRFMGLYEKGRGLIGVATYEFDNILGR